MDEELMIKINFLRKKLNEEFYIDFLENKRNNETTLKISMELDRLINIYYRIKNAECTQCLRK